MKTRSMGLVLAMAGVLAFGAAPALAASRVVAPRKASFGCAKAAQYHSIQAAVAASGSGDVITVCPGTYQEQVTITQNNLTLKSDQPLQATIKAPQGQLAAPGAVVTIGGSTDKLTGFTITNSGQASSCDSINYGVYVAGGRSADIEGNDISDISDTPLSGCQNGVAVEVGDSGAPTPTIGSATVKLNTIENYQKNGVTVDGRGSSASVEANSITGSGPTPTIAQNGVQFSTGATGTIAYNRISNNVYSPGTVSSTGILLCGQGPTATENNLVSTNDTGIYDAYNDSAGGCGQPGSVPTATSTQPQTIINTNTIIASTFDGLVLDAETNAQVKNDQAVGTWGHTAYGSDNGDGFDLFNTTTHSLIQGSTAAGNSEDGFHNETGSIQNTFQTDQAPANGATNGTQAAKAYDCEDDSGGPVLNTWQSDLGDINLPPPICQGNPNVASSGGLASAQALVTPGAKPATAHRRAAPSA